MFKFSNLAGVPNRESMSSNNKFEKVRTFYQQLLPSMNEESWAITESVLSVRSFRKGDFIVREGSVCNYVSYLNHGLVRMYYHVDGKDKIISFCNEGNYISDYQSFLTRRPALTFIQALEDTEVVDTSFDDLQMLYKRVPESNIIGRLIAEQIFLEMCNGSNSEAKETILQRYTNLIISQPWLLQRVPQYMIASYLGITPEALSRIKSRFSKQRQPKELVM